MFVNYFRSSHRRTLFTRLLPAELAGAKFINRPSQLIAITIPNLHWSADLCRTLLRTLGVSGIIPHYTYSHSSNLTLHQIPPPSLLGSLAFLATGTGKRLDWSLPAVPVPHPSTFSLCILPSHIPQPQFLDSCGIT